MSDWAVKFGHLDENDLVSEVVDTAPNPNDKSGKKRKRKTASAKAKAKAKAA